ncbi:MAG: carboxypeptidase-like regulatory domain-containing protein [Chitinophagales bacterium]
MKHIFVIAALIVTLVVNAQSDSTLIQFSGFAMTADSLMGIPYAHISILGVNRKATAGPDGFFSFAAHKGDTLYFTCIGFKPAVYRIPKSLPSDKYSVIQLMSKNEYYLPTAIVYPWGDKTNFPDYFRNLKLPKTEEERAEENTNRQLLAALGEKLPVDGNEATENYLRSQAAKTYYYGQSAPSGLGSPLAWAEFIRAWKRGDFKKKEKYTPKAGE